MMRLGCDDDKEDSRCNCDLCCCTPPYDVFGGCDRILPCCCCCMMPLLIAAVVWESQEVEDEKDTQLLGKTASSWRPVVRSCKPSLGGWRHCGNWGLEAISNVCSNGPASITACISLPFSGSELSITCRSASGGSGRICMGTSVVGRCCCCCRDSSPVDPVPSYAAGRWSRMPKSWGETADSWVWNKEGTVGKLVRRGGGAEHSTGAAGGCEKPAANDCRGQVNCCWSKDVVLVGCCCSGWSAGKRSRTCWCSASCNKASTCWRCWSDWSWSCCMCEKISCWSDSQSCRAPSGCWWKLYSWRWCCKEQQLDWSGWCICCSWRVCCIAESRSNSSKLSRWSSCRISKCICSSSMSSCCCCSWWSCTEGDITPDRPLELQGRLLSAVVRPPGAAAGVDPVPAARPFMLGERERQLCKPKNCSRASSLSRCAAANSCCKCRTCPSCSSTSADATALADSSSSVAHMSKCCISSNPYIPKLSPQKSQYPNIILNTATAAAAPKTVSITSSSKSFTDQHRHK